MQVQVELADNTRAVVPRHASGVMPPFYFQHPASSSMIGYNRQLAASNDSQEDSRVVLFVVATAVRWRN
jgi:hypothetical protein